MKGNCISLESYSLCLLEPDRSFDFHSIDADLSSLQMGSLNLIVLKARFVTIQKQCVAVKWNVY